MERLALIEKKFNELVYLSTNLYNINLGLLTLKTTLRGKKIGNACMGFNPIKLEINLNINAINGTDEQFNHVLNDTLAHEMAHIVNFLSPKTGKNHNRGWKNVCLRLGGNGKARYSSNDIGGGTVSSFKTADKYVYDVYGTTILLGKIRHNRLQSSKMSYYVHTNRGETSILANMFTGTKSQPQIGNIT